MTRGRAGRASGSRVLCDHPLLAPVAACRQCLVEVGMPDRNTSAALHAQPQPSCAVTVTPGMVVKHPAHLRWWIAPSVASWSSCSSTTR